jgi:hypothetical protein
VILNKDPNVYKGNDYTPRLRLEQDDDETGEPEDAVGITDLFVWISATDDGGPIHATLKVAAPELTKRAGTYRGTIDGNDIDAHLFGSGADDHAGKDVFIIAANDGGNVRGVERVKAHKVRRIS